MKSEYKALPMTTINDPKGNPYLSVIDDETQVRIQMHSYDKDFKDRVYFIFDKRAVSELIQALEKLENW